MSSNTRKRKGIRTNNKECRCTIHEQLTWDETPSRKYRTTSRDFSRKSLVYLVNENLIGAKAKYVCDICINYGTKKLEGNSSSHSNVINDEVGAAEGENEFVDENNDEKEVAGEVVVEIGCVSDRSRQMLIDAADVLIKGLESSDTFIDDHLQEKLGKIVFAVAQMVVRPALTDHISSLKNVYWDTDQLKALNSKDFLKSCHPTFLDFISGCTGRYLDRINDTKLLYRYAVVVESIYHLKNSNIVMPHCFTMNLLQISGSKTVTCVNGKLLPGSGDNTMCQWWEMQGSQVLTVPRSIDIAIWYDNVGKYIVKSFRVKAERNDSPTVVTATQCIELSKPATVGSQPPLQQMSSYKSSISDLTEADIQIKMNEIHEKAVEDFRQYRYQFVCSIFNYMLASTEMDTIISQELEAFKSDHLTCKCDKCDKMYPARRRRCDTEGCGGIVCAAPGKTIHYDVSNKMLKFFNVGQKGRRNPVKISTCDPIMENPNSHESIKAIVDILRERAIEDDSDEGRKWVFVGADGPPYCLMRRLKHKYATRYEWLAILFGKGHLKMNMLKCLFKLCDKIIFDVLGQDVLKFDSFKSYDYFIKCKDNHKSYQVLEIFLFGTIMELIRFYSLECSDRPTPSGFLNWAHETSNPTLKFVCQLILNVTLAIYVNRLGDRYNDPKCSNAGRITLSTGKLNITI